MERALKKLYIPILIIFAAVIFLIVCGCSAPPDIRFSSTEISLFVGDERDILPYAVFEPATTENKRFKLKSNDDCVEVRGTKIKAVSPGVAVVTASNGEHTAKMTVSVSYRAAQSLVVQTDGELIRRESDSEPITFTASLDDFVDPDIDIAWSVNGESKGEGSEFIFVPNAVGEFEVTATAAGLDSAETVYVYRETEAEGFGDGELEQYRDFSPVRFYAVEKRDDGNPQSVYRWTVNGEIKSTSVEFEYVPLSLGTYKVELFVNGVKRQVNGKDFETIVASGDRAPNGRVEFDDRDGVFVLWNDRAVARSVSVTNHNGDRSVYNSSDSRYAHLFGDGYFDASGIISPCSAVPRTYTVTVTADAHGEPFVFTQYPYEAEKYIENNVLCRNSFLTDAAQAADWILELYATGKHSAQGYLSREAAAEKDDVTAAAVAAADALGIIASVSVKDNILTVELGSYVNAPTANESVTIRQMRISKPHFETTDSPSLRAKDYRLAIERAHASVDVENTEQLLIAVGYGVKPNTKEGESAARVYTAARNVLLGIIGRNYSDAQKVHAVYDWLQLCTLRVENAKTGSVSDFLEGAFLGGLETSAPLSVSDIGAAKAVALLCGMEGVYCEITCDDGDYYNRVLLDGLWYNVDVYDGEAKISGANNECCTHAGLFFADGCADDANSAYDTSLNYYLQKRNENGVYYDCYIAGADGKSTIGAAVVGAFSRQSRTSFEVRLPDGRTKYSNTDYGAEFMLDGNLTAAERNNAKTLIRAAVAEYLEKYIRNNYEGDDVEQRITFYTGTIRIYEYGNVVWVTAQIPTSPSIS